MHPAGASEQPNEKGEEERDKEKKFAPAWELRRREINKFRTFAKGKDRELFRLTQLCFSLIPLFTLHPRLMLTRSWRSISEMPGITRILSPGMAYSSTRRVARVQGFEIGDRHIGVPEYLATRVPNAVLVRISRASLIELSIRRDMKLECPECPHFWQLQHVEPRKETPSQLEGRVHRFARVRGLIPRLSDRRLIFAASRFRARPGRVLGSLAG